MRGEIARFIAGDPTAGNMTGGYLFKMWGLPAAAAAITLAARPENRAKVGGIMISAALTAFLTGITEPIEFAFLFVAPILYGIHALLAGVAYLICILLGIKHGFTFSHGLIDYVVLFPEIDQCALALRSRTDLGRGLLSHLQLLHPQVRPQDAGPRRAVEEAVAWHIRQAVMSSRCRSCARLAGEAIS